MSAIDPTWHLPMWHGLGFNNTKPMSYDYMTQKSDIIYL